MILNSTTGIIACVSGISDQAKAIQKFQTFHDPASGKWNHTMLVYQSPYDFYVMEEATVKDSKIKANANLSPLGEYADKIKDGLDIMYLIPNIVYDCQFMEAIMFEYNGIPYDYISLTKHQVTRTLFNLWTGRTGEKAARRMVCHEFVMFIWNEYTKRHLGFEIFPKWYTGDVSILFHSAYFLHSETLPNPFLNEKVR